MEVKYYKSKRGDCEILEYIKKEIKEEKHKIAIIDKIDLLETRALQELLKTKVVEKLKGVKNLYELKTHHGKTIHRILFGIINQYFYLVVVFKKKDQKILKKYIDLAIKRINKQ
jgi:phage-related protein